MTASVCTLLARKHFARKHSLLRYPRRWFFRLAGYVGLALLLEAGAVKFAQSFGWDRVGRAMAQVPKEKDAMSKETLGLVAREEEYEVSLPSHWSKRRLPDGHWILYSTKGPETLRVRVLIPGGGEPLRGPAIERAAKAASTALSSEMTRHTVIQSGWEGTVFSITGTGSSLPHKALLAYRVIVNDKMVVWALHEVSFEEVPLKLDQIDADPAMNEHRLAILRSLKFR